MEGRIYPNWEQISTLNNPLTPGELHLLKYLDSNLPKDQKWKKGDKLNNYDGWLIFAQPFLNGSRPDVIIFNPFVGVVIYEVKDWNLSNYFWQDNYGRKSLYVTDGLGAYPVKSPIKQVEYYKKKIIGQLVPSIGEQIDKNKKNFGLIKTGVYFHKATTNEARSKFGSVVKDVKYFPIFGYDSLRSNNIKEIVPDVGITKSLYWNRDWNEEIAFWFNPPYHSIEQGIPLKLKHNQVKIAEPQPGHHRVRGVAGSGKTQALAYRAGKLASKGLNVLIITFNITLWHYIKDMIARSPFGFKWDRFTFNHYHGFCRDKLNEFERSFPRSPKREDFESKDEYEKALDCFFKVDVTNAVIEAIQVKGYDKYDAILIDEGQDYQYEWYDLLSKYFMTSRDELLVVCDKRQNIYERELDWLDKRSNQIGLEKFTNPYINLTSTFRMPRRVAIMSNEFSDQFDLNQELRVSKIKDVPVLIHSQHIVWRNINEEDWKKYIWGAFSRMKKEGYNPSDMVVLLPSHRMGKLCVNLFKEKNIEVNHVFEDDNETRYHPHKKAFYMGDSRLKMSTIHSFKGWELLNIVLFIPKKAPESNTKLDAIVYTAITRTRENLIVLNCNKRYYEFGEKFPTRWDEQM